MHHICMLRKIYLIRSDNDKAVSQGKGGNMDKVYIIHWKYNHSGNSVVAVVPNEEMAKGYLENFDKNNEMYYMEHDVLNEF